MSSSYVEVRESENGTGGGLLDFQLNDCEGNGLDIQTHLDGEPPKDHTYNKDPCIDQSAENNVEISEDEDIPRKSGRSPRNIKHKFIKPRTEVAKTPVKKETPKKTARTKASLTPSESEDEKPVIEKNNKVSDIDNSINEPESAKKRSRKRKTEENETPEVSEETNQKQSRKKRTRASPEKEAQEAADLSESKEEEVEEEEEDVKEVSPAKKSKSGKAKVAKKAESKTPKKEVVIETPKSKQKSVKKDVGATSSDLPPGWTRKIVERKSGKTAGMVDVYIYNPEGMKFRSKPELATYLEKIKSSLRADDFSFKRGVGQADHSPPASAKKSAVKAGKASKHEVPDSPKRKSRSSSIGMKKGAQLKVKISTPRKHTPDKAKKPVEIDSQPSTSGLQSKRTGSNRKKRGE